MININLHFWLTIVNVPGKNTRAIAVVRYNVPIGYCYDFKFYFK